MPTAPLTIGLAGCGRWGRLILRDLVALGCRVAVAARSEESRRAAQDGGADTVVSNLEDLPDAHGYVVATPTSVHAETVLRLIPRNVPLFVEKPLCANGNDARRIVAAAPERVFVMDKWRYHPGVVELARMARAEELGRTLGLHAFRGQWGCPHADCNMAWILAPHDLTIARDVLGHMPDLAFVHTEQEYGELLSLNASFGTVPSFQLECSVRYPVHRRELRLHGSEGVAVLGDAYAEHLLIRRKGSAEPERRPLLNDLPLFLELKAFVEHLRGGPPPHSSAAEGLEIVELIAKMLERAGVREALQPPHAE
ncbi:MAG: Gfo/Idh/MocA family oxidoreductase [Planctomycetes bacterium]|nr:Gfo/Idh/MocA family oxidoreductase [Planctomycetota bacterium]